MQSTIVASDVASVREAITHGETGLLVDFFDTDALALQVSDILANPATYSHIGPNVRKHAIATYDFLTVCLPEHLKQINALVPESKRISFPLIAPLLSGITFEELVFGLNLGLAPY